MDKKQMNKMKMKKEQMNPNTNRLPSRVRSRISCQIHEHHVRYMSIMYISVTSDYRNQIPLLTHVSRDNLETVGHMQPPTVALIGLNNTSSRDETRAD